jgi:hypothetical protein
MITAVTRPNSGNANKAVHAGVLHCLEDDSGSPRENIDWFASRTNSDRDADSILIFDRLLYRGRVKDIAAN